MSRYVLDASVVVKWLLPGADSAAARRWRDSRHDFDAPDLVFAETASAIWSYCRRGELDPANAMALIRAVPSLAIALTPSRALLADAARLAAACGCAFYDALYLALALRLETRVITADDRFVHAVRAVPILAPHVQRFA